MPNLKRTLFLVCLLSALPLGAKADIYDVTLDTDPLIGHPAGPFYIEFAFTDGSGVGDANNTVTIGDFNFGGGSSLGGPIVFGGASGSIETGVSMTDTSFISVFSEQFAPGLQLSFSLDLTDNDDAGGTPDRFSFFVLDSSGVPIPTLAPAGDYFLGADLTSNGPVFDVYGSDPSRPLSVGGPVSIDAPIITSSPEPATGLLLGVGLMVAGLVRSNLRRKK